MGRFEERLGDALGALAENYVEHRISHRRRCVGYVVLREPLAAMRRLNSTRSFGGRSPREALAY